ncbi:site-specific integrase [Oscillatoria amoena NRMC-F 0135]|jgi:integrase|nr:MAG: site-specific integrase [Bacteroidota bacterium]MDL5046966.1 site-specific integrase [Oscillatoria amoena NRMC-F 0135]
MATIKLLLRTAKTLADGTHPIVIRITVNRKSKFIFTGKTAKVSQWDAAAGLTTKKHPLHNELNIYLGQRLLDAQTELLELQRQKKGFSAGTVREIIKDNKPSMTFVQFCDKLLAELKEQGRIGTRSTYRTVKYSILRFTNNNQSLTFSDIDVAFLTKYEQYLKANGFKISYVKTQLNKLKAIVGKAILDRVVKKNNNPFLEYSLSHLRPEYQHRSLDKDTLEKLLSYQAEEGTSKHDTINFFTFSYYCWGMNFTDMAKLQWKNIYNGRLVYNRSKTGKLHNILLLAPALKVIEYYKHLKYGENVIPPAEDYIFPILDPDKYNTASKMANRIELKLSMTNRCLKTIADELELGENVTFYMARHTFATQLLRKDVATAKIQNMLGHSSERMTQTYLDSFKNDELDEVSKLLVG